MSLLPSLDQSRTLYRKVWDTYSGEALHSFPHNHIVRSVAISPSSSHLLTGGQEKKVRMFDLRRPDAEPELFTESGATLSHDGTVKSVVWVGEHTGVTAGEDGVIKYVVTHARGVNSTDGALPDGGTCARGASRPAYRSRGPSRPWSSRPRPTASS